jgi:hypothetical protein
MAKTNTHAEAVNDGLNALKNAYDDSYKKQLISKGREFAGKAKYYPGRAIEDFRYYYFTSKTKNEAKYLYYYVTFSEEDNSKLYTSVDKNAQNIDINNLFNSDNAVTYNNVSNGISMPLYSIEDNNSAQLKDLYGNNDLYYLKYENGQTKQKIISKEENKFIIISDNKILEKEDKNSYYTLIDIIRSKKECNENYIEFVNHIQANSDIDFNTIEDLKNKNYKGKYEFYKTTNTDLYDLLTTIKNQPYHFKQWKGGILSDNNFYAAYKSCYNRVKSHMASMEKGTNMKGKPVYSRYKNPASVNWCNRYAIELTEEIYGKDPITGKSPAPMKNNNNKYSNANRLNTYFRSHAKGDNKVYADLSKKNVKKMWDYINKGYLVMFSEYEDRGIGHIEIGYPDEGENFGVKKTYKEERFHFDAPKYNLGKRSEKMTIGAGNAVGLKTFAQFSWWLENNVNPPDVYLYLGYLKKQ